MNIGRALRIVRKMRKLRQVDVAKAVDMHQRTYAKIEDSTQRPDYPTFVGLCKALDVAVADIYILAMELGDFPISRKDRYAPAYRAIQFLIKDIIKEENNFYA